MMNEPLPSSSRPKELQAAPSEDLVAKYRFFQQSTGADVDVVYHPCSATNTSPSVAFPKSRVIYVELDKDAVEALKNAGCEAHEASALEFNPGPVNVLILLNQEISPDIPTQYVVRGGYTVCNDYHGAASHLRNNPDWELKGVVVPTKDGKLRFDTEQLGDYWKEIESDEEWKAAPFSWGAQDYKNAAIVVESLTGKKENVLAEYRRIVQTAKEQSIAQKKEIIAEHPEWAEFIDPELDMGAVTVKSGERQFVLDTNLPKKKGVVDDLFVFQKKSAITSASKPV